MKTFLIAFSALLAVCSAKPGYGSGYGPSPTIVGGLAYQLQPRARVLIAPQKTYGAQVSYGNPGYGGYGGYGNLGGYGNPGYGGPSISQLIAAGTAVDNRYGGNPGLVKKALALQSPAAIINPNPVLLPSNIYTQASPVILPAPIGSRYSLPATAPQSASAAAAANAVGNKAAPYGQASLIGGPGAIVGPAPGSAYAPAPGPAYAPAYGPY